MKRTKFNQVLVRYEGEGNNVINLETNPLIHDHNTNPTKPNKTAKAIPTTKCTALSPTALIPDEVPLAPAVAELVDVDVAPDAEPDAEVDELELEDAKFATGSVETVVQVPPIKKWSVSSFKFLVKGKGKLSYHSS